MKLICISLITEATSAYEKKAESEKEIYSISNDAKAASEEIVITLSSLTTVTGKVSIQCW